MGLFNKPSPNAGKGKRQGVYTEKQAVDKAFKTQLKAEVRKANRKKGK